jgi:hypothetical protein
LSGTPARFARQSVALPAAEVAVPAGWRRLVQLSVGGKPADALATTRIIAAPR